MFINKSKILGCLFAAVVCLMPAQGFSQSVSTSWVFKAAHQNTLKQVFTYPISFDGNITMPFNSNWTCKKTKVSLNQHNMLVAGFYCEDATGSYAGIIAACPAGNAGFDSSEMLIGNNGSTAVNFTIACQTK